MADKKWYEETFEQDQKFDSPEEFDKFRQSEEQKDRFIPEDSEPRLIFPVDQKPEFEEPEIKEPEIEEQDFGEVELTQEQKKLSKTLEEEKLPDVGLPKPEPEVIKEVDDKSEVKIKSLMKKALSAKGKQRSESYADVYEALEAYEGKETPFIKGLKSRFSKKASDTNNRRHLGDYVDYVKQGRSWSSSRPSRPSVPRETDYSNTIPYDREAISRNADNFRDGFRIGPGVGRPQIMIGDDEYSVTSNHMEETPGRGGHSMKDSTRSSQLLYKDGRVIRHPDGKFNYGLDLINRDSKIRNILSGEVVEIDSKDDNGLYPTGYGRKLVIKTDKFITIDGEDYPLLVHYAHATDNSFDDLNVGDTLEAGQEIGMMGTTGKRGAGSYRKHLDLNGYIIKDGKKVYVSPSEFLPMGPLESRLRRAKGGEVNPRIPRKKGQPAKSKKHSDLYTDEDPVGTIQGLGFKDVSTAKASVSKIRKSSRSHAHKVQAAVAMEQRAREMGKTSEAAVYRKFIDQMKERTKKMKKAKGGEIKGYDNGGEVYDEGKEGKVFGKGRAARILGKADERGEYRVRGGGKEGRKNRAFDRLSDEAKKLPFLMGGDPEKGTAIFEKVDPKKDPDYYGMGISGGYETLSETVDPGKRAGQENTREITKDVMRVSDPVIEVKQYRDPNTGKIVKYLAPSMAQPFYKEGGKFPRRRSISITGGRRKGDFAIPEASEFKNRDVAERLSQISPFERLEGEGMSYGRDSAEFGTELYDSPRSFSNMPERSKYVNPATGERDYIRSDLRKVAGYGDAGDLALRYFGEAWSKADAKGRKELADANPELVQEYFQHRRQSFEEGGEVKGYDNGGEVNNEFDFEDFGSGQDYIDSMQYDMPPLATRPDLRQTEPSGPIVPGVPEIKPVVDQPDTITEEVDVESLVKGYVEGGKLLQDREQLKLLVNQGIATNEEISSLIDKYDRPTPEDMTAQGGREPRDTPPGPMMRKALGLDKKPTKKSRGATGSFDDDVTTTDAPPATDTKKRPPLTEEKTKTFRQMFDEAERQRVKDEADLRKKEDEILAIVQRPIDRKRIYKNMSTVDKVIALLSLAAGQYDAMKFGQPNLYLKQLDKAMEDDIKEQNLDNREKEIRKAQLLRDAKILSGRLARATKDRDKKEGFLKNESVLDKAYQKQLRGRNEKVRKIKFIETLNKRGLTSREVAFADSIYPELKVGNKVIKGRDGLFYYTRGDVKKLKEYISDAQDSIDGLAQLEEYVDKVSLLEQIPGASIFSKDAAGAQSLRDRLVGKLRIEFFGPGVMTDNEREQAKKILGNPNEFFSTDSVEKEKIRNLLLKINYGIRQKLRRDGLAIPESQNDRMVKAWLRRERKPLTDSNKALAVNALIKAEKKHVENGGRPGKHWMMDEPLPI